MEITLSGVKKRLWFEHMKLGPNPPQQSQLEVGKRPTDLNVYGSCYTAPVNIYSIGQCTWYCWGRALEKCGVRLTFSGTANAGAWYANASGGYSYKAGPSSTPVKNSVASFSNSTAGNQYGHVVYVEDVVGDTVYYTEANNPGNNVLDNDDGIVRTTTVAKFKTLYGKVLNGYIVLQ